MCADVVPAQTSVGVPSALSRLEGPVFSNEPHVLRQTGVVAIGNVAHLIRSGTQQLVRLWEDKSGGDASGEVTEGGG